MIEQICLLNLIELYIIYNSPDLTLDESSSEQSTDLLDEGVAERSVRGLDVHRHLSSSPSSLEP